MDREELAERRPDRLRAASRREVSLVTTSGALPGTRDALKSNHHSVLPASLTTDDSRSWKDCAPTDWNCCASAAQDDCRSEYYDSGGDCAALSGILLDLVGGASCLAVRDRRASARVSARRCIEVGCDVGAAAINNHSPNRVRRLLARRYSSWGRRRSLVSPPAPGPLRSPQRRTSGPDQCHQHPHRERTVGGAVRDRLRTLALDEHR